MRPLRLAPVLLVAALLSGCGDDASRPAAAVPTTPVTTRTTPPPATEMGAISRDSQAKLTAEGAMEVVAACFAKSHDYRRCTTDQPDSQLAAYPAATWGTDPGQVSIQAAPSGYLIDSHSYSGAHFVIEQSAGTAPQRTCGDSASECKSGTW